jgi:hypothetical protein
MGRSSSPVGYGIGIAEVVGSNPTRSTCIYMTFIRQCITILRWKHVIPIKRNGVLVAAKLIVTNTKINNRHYYSFITPEAYNLLKDYTDFRALHGEKITGESWLIRDTWQRLNGIRNTATGWVWRNIQEK